MNQREKEEYLRDYAILKAQGKPFFPYAVAKDGAMAVVVMAVIIAMSLVLGAELGPKANPTTTTYVPRPEWYFFFLFEVLRVVKPPSLVGLEAGQVRAMFDRIAGVYDAMNTAMTAGLHHHWRARAADLAEVGPRGRVLDVATGTGDMAIELARRVSPGGEVVGSDFAEGMLDRARAVLGVRDLGACAVEH